MFHLGIVDSTILTTQRATGPCTTLRAIMTNSQRTCNPSPLTFIFCDGLFILSCAVSLRLSQVTTQVKEYVPFIALLLLLPFIITSESELARYTNVITLLPHSYQHWSWYLWRAVKTSLRATGGAGPGFMDGTVGLFHCVHVGFCHLFMLGLVGIHVGLCDMHVNNVVHLLLQSWLLFSLFCDVHECLHRRSTASALTHVRK